MDLVEYKPILNTVDTMQNPLPQFGNILRNQKGGGNLEL